MGIRRLKEQVLCLKRSRKAPRPTLTLADRGRSSCARVLVAQGLRRFLDTGACECMCVCAHVRVADSLSPEQLPPTGISRSSGGSDKPVLLGAGLPKKLRATGCGEDSCSR